MRDHVGSVGDKTWTQPIQAYTGWGARVSRAEKSVSIRTTCPRPGRAGRVPKRDSNVESDTTNARRNTP